MKSPIIDAVTDYEDSYRDLDPTDEEEKLAHFLANVFSCRLRRKPVEWNGSLDVNWETRQAWYFVARAAILNLRKKANSVP